MSKPNWIAIRNDYINGNISYRKLAEKYEVSFNTLQEKARKEEWFKKRKEQHDKIAEKTLQKTGDKIATAEAKRMARINAAADRLLDKIEKATEQLDQFLVESTIKQKEVKYESSKAGFGKPKKEIIKEVEDKRIVKTDFIDKKGLKDLASALKDLKDIQLVKDDEKEQESPNINITITAATPDDMAGDE